MFIPLGTDRPLRHRIIVTYALIGLNIAVYAYQLVLQDSSLEEFVKFMNLAEVSRANFHWWQLLSASFLHSPDSKWHLIGNMVFLYVFGPNIEDRLGRFAFLAFYLIGGCAAMAAHIAFSPYPAVGASGAIAALTGAYLIMFPRTMIKTFSLINVGIFSLTAWWFIGIAIIWDLASQAFGHDNIAHAAHLGGYGFGAAVAFLLLWAKVIPREPYDLFSATRQAYRRRQIAQVGRDYQRVVQQRIGSDKGSDGLQVVSDEVAVMRSGVTALVAAAKFPEAAIEYKKLADTYGHLPRGSTLSRRYQYDLANYLYMQQDYNSAAYAYERFLDAYPKDPESPQIRLLVGRIYARQLNDPIKAKALLSAALADLRDEENKAIAREELAALG